MRAGACYVARAEVYLMGAFYVAAGVAHLTSPGFFLQIVPFLPAGRAVWISGAAEIASACS